MATIIFIQLKFRVGFYLVNLKQLIMGLKYSVLFW